MLNIKDIFKSKKIEPLVTNYTTNGSSIDNTEVKLKMVNASLFEERDADFRLTNEDENKCKISEFSIIQHSGNDLPLISTFVDNDRHHKIDNCHYYEMNEYILVEAIYLFLKTGDTKSFLDMYRLGNADVKKVLKKSLNKIVKEYKSLNLELEQFEDNIIFNILDDYIPSYQPEFTSSKNFVNQSYNIELEKNGNIYRCYKNAYGPGHFRGIYGWLSREEECLYYPTSAEISNYAEKFAQSNIETYQQLLYEINGGSRYYQPLLDGGKIYCKKLCQLDEKIKMQ